MGRFPTPPRAWELELFHPAGKMESEVKMAVFRPGAFACSLNTVFRLECASAS